MTEGATAKTARLVRMPPDLARRYEDFRWDNRFKTDNAAVCRLIEIGLDAAVNGPALAALKAAAERFREYERHHRAKPDHEKADRNREMAEMCEAAILGTTP